MSPLYRLDMQTSTLSTTNLILRSQYGVSRKLCLVSSDQA
jgi:hypothetical protein